MTDEERIARLTELARQVFGDELAKNIPPVIYEDGFAMVRGRWCEHMRIRHPRGLDALEAALLVLVEEP